MNLVGPHLQREAECETVLRSLPMWFGIEDALLMYARDTKTNPTFALESGERIVGFVTLQQHFPHAWEIHCMAMAADARNSGFGTKLLLHAENWLRDQGARYLQVKTVADTSPSKEYAETRKFYAAKGFVPLEVFPTLWSPRNPALQLIKILGEA
jgi:GNAT superfamily N-acetyltransferase